MKRDSYEYDLKVTSCNLLVIQIQIKILVKMTSMGGGGGAWWEAPEMSMSRDIYCANCTY